ncbi:MAG TPA: prolyl oligopeptidase family serine peptidase [Gemmatimonadales bacterium]|jgi:dipeptidyl aminopeptidase/acylaminoacyl peptidase
MAPCSPRTLISGLLATALGTVAPLAAQRADTSTFHLDVASIMRGEETVGREPANIQWSPDSKWIYFQWAPPGTDWRAPTTPYRVRAEAGAVPEKVTRQQVDSMNQVTPSGLLSHDGHWRAMATNGDLWITDAAGGARRQLTSTVQNEQPLGWSLDDARLFYRVGDAVFALTLANGFTDQLAEIRAAASDSASNGTTPTGRGGRGGAQQGAAAASSPQRAALARDQQELFNVLHDRAYADSLSGGGRGGRGGRGGFGGGRGGAGPSTTSSLRPVMLARGEQLRSLWVSPRGTQMLFTVGTGAATTATEIPTWVTASGYVTDQQGRSKVGDVTGTQRMGLLDFATSRVTWLQPIAGDTSSHWARLSSFGWNDAGTAAVVVAEPSNYKLRMLARLDPDAARLVPLETLRDSAWVGGPCEGCGGWLPGDQGLWFVNESDGWAHVYTMHTDGSARRQLTSGKWEVLTARLSPDRSHFEMHTSEPSVYEQHFYTMALDGSQRTRLTTRPGWHDVTVSPDGKLLADVYSYSNVPPELYVSAAAEHAVAARLTTSPTAAWGAHKWLAPDIITIKASDGVEVPARIYRPEQLGAHSNGAAVLFVHGAGYLHNVTRGWSSYFREYQFNQLLASRGYLVLDLDYRGSAGYGRDWRTAIYRHMGGRDLDDYVDASKWVTAKYGISAKHIGIYGGSYGGFMTLMALFTKPDYFGAGAALRAVSDWAHYNHGYTAQILNQPQDDSIAYHQSSPIFFAAGLRAPLLMAHGMVDSNVEFEDAVRLTQRLIELGKVNWWLAPYPVEDHGFTRPDSWTDEYTRILTLFNDWLPRGAIHHAP